MHDTSDQNTTICDSNNAQLAEEKVDCLKVENIMNSYSTANVQEFNLTNKHDKHRLYKNFIAFNCEVCSLSTLIDYADNPTLTMEEDYLKNCSNLHLYTDLRDNKYYTGELERLRRDDRNLNLYVTLKSAAAKK